MNDTWEQIEDIFQAVIEQPPDERLRFLNEKCNGNESLRREVESLLDSYQTGFLEQSPIEEFADVIVDSNTDKPAGGEQFGSYKIIRKLGAGGMGEVFLAEDSKLKRQVALKFLSAQVTSDDEQLARFMREAQTVSALNHPNILTVYEIGVENDVHFIATEFIDGSTLREYLRSDKQPVNKLFSIAVQAAEAFTSAHEAGIIHRDIKPENIMIRRDGYVKVLDFGLAKLTEKRASTKDLEAETQKLLMTSPGLIMGTACYMSPEQTRGLADVDARADVWSLGVVLFEMFAGRAPFEGGTVSDLIASILKSDTPRLSKFMTDCPSELERIVTKALQKDRDERYQGMKDLLLDLKSLKREMEISSQHDRIIHRSETNLTATIPERLTAAKTIKRSSAGKYLAGFLASVIVLGSAWWFLGSGSKQNEFSELKNAEIVNWSSSSGEFYSTGSFSPDATMIAFTSTKSGTRNIWIKQTGSGEAIQVTRDEFKNESPIWSPDGEWLAFFSTRGKERNLWQIPKLGGSPKLIATIEDGSTLLKFWSKQDLIYYESNNNLFAIDVNSKQIKQITDFAANAVASASISISPDEKQITYITVENKIWSLWAKNLNGGDPKKLFTAEAEIKNTVWHSDNQRIFYSALVDSAFQIFVTDAGDAAPPKQITSSERDSFVRDVSGDGSKILYGSAKEESDIWGVNLKDAKEFIVASDINSELWANVSPDGKSIAYQSIKNLSQGNKIFNGTILIKKLNSDELPTELVANAFLPVWSPDGQQIAFTQTSGSEYQIGTIKVAGGGQKHLTTGGTVPVNFSLLPYNRIQTSYISWSPDSSKIAYVSDQNDRSNIRLVNADGSNEAQLTQNADPKLYFYCPLWSSDGKRIAFSSKTGNSAGKPTYSIWVIDVETGNATIIAQQQTFFRLISWLPGNNEVVMASINGSESAGLLTEVSLFQAEIESRKMRQITVLKEAYATNIQMSPDKKSFAFAAHLEGNDNLWLIPATGGEAKKITGNNDSRLYFSSLSWSPDGGTIFFGKQSRYSLLSMLTNFK